MTIKRKPHKDNPYSSFPRPTEIKLKRTELKRKTPMKPISDKARKHYQATKGLRRDPIDKFGVLCDFPGCESLADDPHEITCGPDRQAAMENPRLLMYVCRKHHSHVQGMPYAKQIAMVALSMVRSVNRVRRCNAVSVEKVVLYLGTDT